MPSRAPRPGRTSRGPIVHVPARRPAAPRVALITVLTAALVAVAGGGEATWLCLPGALLAVAATRRRAGAVLGTLAVAGPAVAAGVLVAGGPGGVSVPVLVVATAASAAVLVSVRERLVSEREMLRDFALSDPVTGISNRRSLLMRADYEIERHRRARRSFALVMLDLDGFKALNDRFGHAAGDDLLRDVAASLKRAMRGQDTVARFGGDEFCILAPETDERGVARLATRVTQAVGDVSVGLDAVAGSVGVAIFPVDGPTVSELMRAADERLLEAKRRRPEGRTRRRAA